MNIYIYVVSEPIKCFTCLEESSWMSPISASADLSLFGIRSLDFDRFDLHGYSINDYISMFRMKTCPTALYIQKFLLVHLSRVRLCGPVIQANGRLILEVRRSARLHYTVNQRPHWPCWQYGLFTGYLLGFIYQLFQSLYTLKKTCLRFTNISMVCLRDDFQGISLLFQTVSVFFQKIEIDKENPLNYTQWN